MRLDRIITTAGAALLTLGSLAACEPAPAGGTGGGGQAPSGTHPGGPDGAPPCAPEDFPGEDGATVDEPEKYPLQEQERWALGRRWAICGAGTVESAELLSLQSTDDGATWTVTDTGLEFMPFHGGDHVGVDLMNMKKGTIRLVSRVGETDKTYETTDGGQTWELQAAC